MKLQPNSRIWIACAVLILAILACGPNVMQPLPTVQPTPVSTNVEPNPSVSRSDLIKATVQILMAYNVNGKLTPKYQGSGTIISSTGLILTNAHVASPASQGEPDIEPDALAIGLTNQEDIPPVFLYYAKVKAVDGFLDLAVIQITSTLDGTNLDPNSLNLPYVRLGNSDDLIPGQHINLFSFPTIGGETIIYTDGLIAGFSPEEGIGDRAWIKTDAVPAGGISSGLAANDAGFVIGIPSIVASGANATPDCRRIADTNGDGVIDEKDICVPVGVSYGGIRPVNLALPLIKAVETGQRYVSPYDTAQAPTPNSPSP